MILEQLVEKTKVKSTRKTKKTGKVKLEPKVKSTRKTMKMGKVNDGVAATTTATTVTRKRKVREEEEEEQVKDGGVAAAADWMDLPPELLQLVAGKLTNICDYIRFRSVCARWHSSTGTGGPHQWLPWLIFTPAQDGDTLPIFNPADRRFYYLSLPEEARAKTVMGSGHGWLAMSRSKKISLYNPFTRACIVLPTEVTSNIYGVIICCNPATASPRQLMVSILQCKGLLIYRQGDDSYVEIKIPPGFSYLMDVIYHEEKATLYAVCSDGMLAVVDLASSTMRPLIDIPSPEIVYLVWDIQLVLAAGDLLLLVWDLVKLRPPKFVVFKLDRSKEGCFKWVRATSISDSVLFVSRFHSISGNVVCAQDFPDGRANQIYHIRAHDILHRNGCSDIRADIKVRDLNRDSEQLCFRVSGRVKHMLNHPPRLAWMFPVLN